MEFWGDVAGGGVLAFALFWKLFVCIYGVVAVEWPIETFFLINCGHFTFPSFLKVFPRQTAMFIMHDCRTVMSSGFSTCTPGGGR